MQWSRERSTIQKFLRLSARKPRRSTSIYHRDYTTLLSRLQLVLDAAVACPEIVSSFGRITFSPASRHRNLTLFVHMLISNVSQFLLSYDCPCIFFSVCRRNFHRLILRINEQTNKTISQDRTRVNWRMHRAWLHLELIWQKVSYRCTGNPTGSRPRNPWKGTTKKRDRKKSRRCREESQWRNILTRILFAVDENLSRHEISGNRCYHESTTRAPRDYSFSCSLQRFTCALAVSRGEFGLEGIFDRWDSLCWFDCRIAWCRYWEQRGSSNLRSRECRWLIACWHYPKLSENERSDGVSHDVDYLSLGWDGFSGFGRISLRFDGNSAFPRTVRVATQI